MSFRTVIKDNSTLSWFVRIFVFLNTAGVLCLAYWTGQRVQRVDDMMSRVVAVEKRVETINVPVIETKLGNVESRLRELSTEISELRRAIIDSGRAISAIPRR